MKILKSNSPIDLNELKTQQGLTKNKSAKVAKTEGGLFVTVVD